jgi:hypothetical protein
MAMTGPQKAQLKLQLQRETLTILTDVSQGKAYAGSQICSRTAAALDHLDTTCVAYEKALTIIITEGS